MANTQDPFSQCDTCGEEYAPVVCGCGGDINNCPATDQEPLSPDHQRLLNTLAKALTTGPAPEGVHSPDRLRGYAQGVSDGYCWALSEQEQNVDRITSIQRVRSPLRRRQLRTALASG